MYIVTGQGQTTSGDKILMSTEPSSRHFGHLLQVSNKPLWSLTLYKFVHDFIHVYSPGTGADNTLGTRVWCQQEHLVTSVICYKLKKISLKSDFIHFFSWFYTCILPRGRDWQSPGEERFMPTGTSCHFRHLLQVSNKSLWSLILYNYFMILYMFTAQGRGRPPPWDKILKSTERPYHFTHLLQVSKKSLWSLILYNF